MGRVRVKKVGELEDHEISQSEIGKGVEYARDQVAISDAELRDLPLPTAKAIEIEAFVPLDSIDPIQIGEATPSPRTGPWRRSPTSSTPGKCTGCKPTSRCKPSTWTSVAISR